MFFRRFSNPFENRYYKPPRLDDLLPSTKDTIFTWQLSSQTFTSIDADTILRAGICPSKPLAEKILKTCHKLGIIDSETGHPNTRKIDRGMVSSMPRICVQKQRELVMLLFFWEEESTRWRLLSAEEEELQGREGDGVRMELEVVRAKKRVLPSLRDQSGRVLEGEGERLPSYAEVRAEGRHGSM